MLFLFFLLFLIGLVVFVFYRRLCYFVVVFSFFLLASYLLFSHFDSYSFFFQLSDTMLFSKGLMFFSFGSLVPAYSSVLLMKGYSYFVFFVAFAIFSFAKVFTIVLAWFLVPDLFFYCVDSMFILLLDFYFQSYILSPAFGFLLSPFFLGFLLQDFRLFFFIYFFFCSFLALVIMY